MEPVSKSSKRRHKAKVAKALPNDVVMVEPAITDGKENGPNCHSTRPAMHTDRTVDVTDSSPAKDTVQNCVASQAVTVVVENNRSGVCPTTTDVKAETSTKPEKDTKLSDSQPTSEKSDKEIPTKILDSDSRNVPSCTDSVKETSGNAGKPEASRNKPDNAASVKGAKSPPKKETKGITADGAAAAEASDAPAQKSKADLRRERNAIQVCV